MAWRDELQKASFRGVRCHARVASGQIGRRNVVHEYPLRDIPYVEDMGRKARQFTLELFVLGPDYMRDRDALEAAFEQPGPGELIHPWRGRMNVAVISCTPNESIDQGGMASWSVTFSEAGDNQQPSIRPDLTSQVDMAADTATSASTQDFENKFSVDGQPDFVFNDASSRVSSAINDITAAAKEMLPDMSILPVFQDSASQILGSVTSLLRVPTDLAASITGQIAGVRGLALAPTAAWDALLNLFGYGQDIPVIPATTPARTAQSTNQQAVYAVVRQTALAEAARATARMDFSSVNDAIATRDTLAAAIETEAETAPDEVYVALKALRVAVIKDITARGADLAKVVTYTPRATLPALVIAYQLYSDATRDAEIIAHNNIRHPGFVPGGEPLEVLA